MNLFKKLYCRLRYGKGIIMDCPVHNWFELSYAQYLTIPRSILQAMPLEWKERFTKCLYELDDTIDWRPRDGRYWCRLRNSKGRFIEDPFMEYRHPTFDIPFKNRKQ
jgi:hypothetical protein